MSTDLVNGTFLATAVEGATDRFDYQRRAVGYALRAMAGPVLNVGCKEDPAHLKWMDAVRVVNCDLTDRDELEDREIHPDMMFDCARDRWPFEDESVAMVVMADILEHLDVGVTEPDEAELALSEARRVAKTLCVTVPMDTDVDLAFADSYSRGVRHRTCFTPLTLQRALRDADWTWVHWRTFDYEFLPVGFLVCCV